VERSSRGSPRSCSGYVGTGRSRAGNSLSLTANSDPGGHAWDSKEGNPEIDRTKADRPTSLAPSKAGQRPGGFRGMRQSRGNRRPIVQRAVTDFHGHDGGGARPLRRRPRSHPRLTRRFVKTRKTACTLKKDVSSGSGNVDKVYSKPGSMAIHVLDLDVGEGPSPEYPWARRMPAKGSHRATGSWAWLGEVWARPDRVGSSARRGAGGSRKAESASCSRSGGDAHAPGPPCGRNVLLPLKAARGLRRARVEPRVREGRSDVWLDGLPEEPIRRELFGRMKMPACRSGRGRGSSRARRVL